MVSENGQNRPEDYPFTSLWFEQPDSGYRQHYLDEGKGPPVVMVHGNPTWSYYYRHLIKALAPERRCIVPDHLGCGYSDKPQDWSYRLADHIQNLRHLLDHLSIESFDLVVHDWGGPIGLGAALEKTEQIRRVVILNTAAFPSQRIPKRIALCRMPGLGEFLIRAFNAFAWPATWMATTRGFSRETKKNYLLPYDSWANRIAIARFVQDIPLEKNHPSYPSLEWIESQLDILREKPVRILWGGKDFCFNQLFFEEWKQWLPGAETTLYGDAGHYVLEDARPGIEESIRSFLTK